MPPIGGLTTLWIFGHQIELTWRDFRRRFRPGREALPRTRVLSTGQGTSPRGPFAPLSPASHVLLSPSRPSHRRRRQLPIPSPPPPPQSPAAPPPPILPLILPQSSSNGCSSLELSFGPPVALLLVDGFTATHRCENHIQSTPGSSVLFPTDLAVVGWRGSFESGEGVARGGVIAAGGRLQIVVSRDLGRHPLPRPERGVLLLYWIWASMMSRAAPGEQCKRAISTASRASTGANPLQLVRHLQAVAGTPPARSAAAAQLHLRCMSC
ncbi:uncharacterized protein [Lolium perenne]|uniref:uncharacterized protein n=1 Tax=Lolium perenne TaxID=4522 RepID=UPI0021F56E2A|nr:uncharacterized protein LOC127328942 [Lolium perenne]